MGSIHEIHPLEIKDDRPFGIRLIENPRKKALSYQTYQAIALVVTFLSYTTYHVTRKTTSIVKSALDPQSLTSVPYNLMSYSMKSHVNDTVLGGSSGAGWAPFNGNDGTTLLGYLDMSFLAVYAAGMFFSGHIGDRMNLRLLTALFGFGYWFEIHNFYYYLIVQMLAGVVQSTGWPSVVAVVGNWFGKGGRGLIMGIWNPHTSVGNIVGSLMASSLLKYGWGWSMFVPGIVVGFAGLVVFTFLPISPLSCGMHMCEDDPNSPKKEALEEPFLPHSGSSVDGSGNEAQGAVGFLEAWRIPGVANYALCLFFVKLVAYTFLYWLPFYISYTEIGGEYLSSETAGNLSTFFDIGGVIGGILAGFVSDKLGASLPER
ncbi:hypothetical protein RND81_14G128000 [Saponaria officinalis]|uniref:Major facilitator superfamily (MFS) profile domain-containing protein n=1 Tax=Saponaria officinalis TaxID=3572 RepID=A0AAW1GL43_SAPOF